MNGYLYDPHTHTAETSKCGHLPAAEVVDRYVRQGFSGLVVTDHLHPEYLSRIDTDHDWTTTMTVPWSWPAAIRSTSVWPGPTPTRAAMSAGRACSCRSG